MPRVRRREKRRLDMITGFDVWALCIGSYLLTGIVPERTREEMEALWQSADVREMVWREWQRDYGRVPPECRTQRLRWGPWSATAFGDPERNIQRERDRA